MPFRATSTKTIKTNQNQNQNQSQNGNQNGNQKPKPNDANKTTTRVMHVIPRTNISPNCSEKLLRIGPFESRNEETTHALACHACDKETTHQAAAPTHTYLPSNPKKGVSSAPTQTSAQRRGTLLPTTAPPKHIQQANQTPKARASLPPSSSSLRSRSSAATAFIYF